MLQYNDIASLPSIISMVRKFLIELCLFDGAIKVIFQIHRGEIQIGNYQKEGI
jgi:hypothetical protein